MKNQVRDTQLDMLDRLRELMTEKDLSALIISHDDEYLSASLTPDCERISTLTGFTGSAGTVCIAGSIRSELPETIFSQDKSAELPFGRPAAVFVDGRYKVQVKEQVDLNEYDTYEYSQVSAAQWLAAILPRNAKVGIDLSCISYRAYQKLKQELRTAHLFLEELPVNPVDSVWDDRPERSCSQVEIYPDEYNGCPSLQKRQNLALELRNNGYDAAVMCSPESICWLLNIRGRDRACLPVINCRLVAYANEALEWYIDDAHLAGGIEGSLEEHFGHVDIFPERRFDDVLDRLCGSNCRVYVDPDATNAHTIKRLYDGGARVVEGLGLCELPKAVKNPLEIAGEHRAHIKDGIAMIRFMAWLDDITRPLESGDRSAYQRRVRDLDEGVMAERAETYRRIEGEYLGPSFDTISALGPNAAMCHYNHAENPKPRRMGTDPMYLIDSGAHFIEGTTDITRTILVGPGATEEMKTLYTLVMKAHIALASAVFPRGTSGLQLDAIARRPLWDYGYDYAHGTGHGVGHLLSVHEGPHGISTRYSSVPLEPGMVVSIEPGFYKENEYGIRLENLVVVTPCSLPNLSHMLCFQPLTLVPFDTRLLIRELLLTRERNWLNNYHQNVYNMIKSAASTLSDIEENFLTAATQPI